MKPTRIFTMVMALLLGMLIGWYSGVELLQRGMAQGTTILCSLGFAVWIGAYPGRYKDEE